MAQAKAMLLCQQQIKETGNTYRPLHTVKFVLGLACQDCEWYSQAKIWREAQTQKPYINHMQHVIWLVLGGEGGIIDYLVFLYIFLHLLFANNKFLLLGVIVESSW